MGAIVGLAEIVLIVGDIEQSLHFYRDTLGLGVISPSTLKGPVFLQAGSGGGSVPQQIVLVPRPANVEPAAAPRMGRALHHIGLQVAPGDYEAEEARLESLGFELRHGEHPFLPVRAFYLDDPDGNEVEIVSARP